MIPVFFFKNEYVRWFNYWPAGQCCDPLSARSVSPMEPTPGPVERGDFAKRRVRAVSMVGVVEEGLLVMRRCSLLVLNPWWTGRLFETGVIRDRSPTPDSALKAARSSSSAVFATPARPRFSTREHRRPDPEREHHARRGGARTSHGLQNSDH